MAATQFQPRSAWVQVKFVMDNQYGFWGDIVKSGGGRNGLTASIHIGGGNQQPYITVVDSAPTGFTKKLCFLLQADIVATGQRQDEIGPGIVAGSFIPGAGISQPHDELNRSIHQAEALFAEILKLGESVFAVSLFVRCCFIFASIF